MFFLNTKERKSDVFWIQRKEKAMVLVSFEWQGDNNISIIRSSKKHKSSHYRILLWSVTPDIMVNHIYQRGLRWEIQYNDLPVC